MQNWMSAAVVVREESIEGLADATDSNKEPTQIAEYNIAEEIECLMYAVFGIRS